MSEPSAEPAPIPPPSLNQSLLDAMERYAGETCFRVWRSGRYRDVSFRHLRRQTLRLAAALTRLGYSGERVAIWGPNSPEWMVCYLGTLFAGAVAVPMRRSLPRQASLSQLCDSKSRLAFVQNSELVRRLDAARSELCDLECLVVIEDPDPETEAIEWLHIEKLSDLVSERLSLEQRDKILAAAAGVEADRVATISYTTTQTGEPLGAIFDHGQRAKALDQLAEWFTLADDDLAFTGLPWGQAASLDASLHYLRSGVPNVLSHGRELVFEEIQQASPTLVLTVPHVLERAYDEIIDASIRRLPESTQEMFFWALGTGKKMRAAGDTASQELRERFARADRTFFSRIRGAFGGRFRRFFCTGAPLPRGLAESIQAIGLEPINLYSLTEAGGFPAVNEGVAPRADACGRPAPGFEIRIDAGNKGADAGDAAHDAAHDADHGGETGGDLSDLGDPVSGEILVRGASVMRGYWNRAEATERVLGADGWLRTGDLGHLDEQGVLHLTGRVGTTLLLSTGRRVDPLHVEKLLAANPFVDQAVVFGDGRPYVTALLVPDLEALATFIREHHEDASASAETLHGPAASSLKWYWQVEGEEPVTTSADPRVQKVLEGVVERVNGQLDDWERIERFCLVGQRISAEADHLAEVRARHRGELAQHFSEQLRAMYPRGMVTADREITQVTVGPERLRELLEKESILDAWTADAGIDFLFDVARDHGIDTPSVVHICDAATSVAQMELEEKPLSTALIVGDPVRIHRVLPSSIYRLYRHDHIRRLRSRLVDLSGLVDGLVLGYVVDRHGYVRGICRLQIDLPPAPEAIFGPQFRLHAEISRRCDAVVFFVPRGGRQVRIFARGELKGRYSSGDWSAENASAVEQTLDRVAEQREEDGGLLRRLVRCAFRMSEENQGAIFMLGDADAILAKSDPSDLNRFAWLASSPVGGLSDDELIAFAKQDGATVIDAASGRFRGCMILLRPDASTRADVGEGKGARHSSAAKTSAETGALAITVSQDGPITIYADGRRVLSL